MKYYIKELRIHHWIKNLLIFAALFFAGELFSLDCFLRVVFGVIAFSMVASIIYIINDIQDVEKDRMHRTKCHRPIASGAISIRNAYIMIIILALIAVCFNILIGSIYGSIVLLIYFVLNLLYSMGLKNIPIVDLFILCFGFFIRILYGAVITNIEISNWLYLTVIAAAFYFALGKRRNELRQIGGQTTRDVLKYYTESFLDRNMYMCLSLVNVFYALWSTDKGNVAAYNNRLVWTFPLVLLITMKYSLDVEGDSDGDPVSVLVRDKVLIGVCIIYVIVIFMILYLG